MLLSNLFKGAPEIEIEQLSCDSRLPMKDAIFFCISGLKYDGHDFVSEAISNGAKVIIYQNDIDKSGKAIYIKVKNVVNILINVANIFYNNPLNEINSYVVSGCYGRSSVSTLIYSYINSKISAGYIGRFGIKYNQNTLMTSSPTLTLFDSMRYISTMKKDGIKAITLEANSSSLAYNKLDFIKPDIFIYTNTSKDSVDYKESGGDYFLNIERYLYSLEDKTKVVINIDDEAYEFLHNSITNPITYGLNEKADYQILNIKEYRNKTSFSIKHKDEIYPIVTNLLSKSNVLNLTACIVALVENDYDFNDVISFFSNSNYIPGTYELIDNEYCVLIDSAYNYDSLKADIDFACNVKENNRLFGLISISYWMEEENIRKIMDYASKYLDQIILTVDECNDTNIYQMLNNAAKYLTNTKPILIEDRETAIEMAINLITKQDILLITGKGSENYLFTANGKVPYDTDKVVALKYIKQRRQEENETI